LADAGSPFDYVIVDVLKLVREGGLPHRCIIDEEQSAGDLLPILDASARTSFVAHLEAPYL